MTHEPDTLDIPEAPPSRSPEDDARALRLRGDPPRVVRLSRKVLATGAAIAALAIGAALTFALQPNRRGEGAPELYNTEHRAVSERVTTAPRDYSQLPPDIPQLGPPLPGDLGEPILNAQRRGEDVPVPPIGPGAGGPSGAAAPSPEELAAQRVAQEQEAALASRLFLGGQGSANAIPQGTAPAGDLASPAGLTGPQASVPASGPRAFLEAESDRRTVNADRLVAPASPYVVQAGSVITAALITGLRSDLPGQVTAQVTQNVFDSPTGRILLIPQGARLLGDYDSQVAAGQSRLMVVWTRLILPDGRSIVLERHPAGDASGYAGLQDRVDRHWGQLVGMAALSTILGVGAELGRDSDDEIARAIRDAGQNTFNQAGQEMVRRQLAIPPTLTIRPGYPVRVLVSRDLVLEPLGVRP
jgi:type IV secretion system protein TrbI